MGGWTAMNCAQKDCLATVTWFGHPDDPALAALAKQSGWRVFEGKGWLCKHHQPQPALAAKGTGDE